MQLRKLGKTGLSVSCLGFGGMELRLLNEKSACNLLGAALDGGITYIDTSPEYPMSECYIGKAISHRRGEFVLATKAGDNMSGEGATYVFNRATILENLEESLRLMKTDYVDVLGLHGVTPEMLPGGPLGEAMEAMREAKASGKALHLGVTVCNRGPGHYGYPAGYGYHSVMRFAAWEDIEVVQLVYGALTRLSENAMHKAYLDHGTGIVARGAMKRYDDTYDSKWEAARLDELCKVGESRADFLLRYALSHPAIACAIVGTKSVGHLRANIGAAQKGALSPDVYAEAKRRLNFAGCVPGPVDMKLDW